MSLSAGVLAWIDRVFMNATATAPNASGSLTFYQSGTSTLQNTYADSALTTPNANPIVLGADGRPTVPVFMLPASYKIVVKDSTGATIYTRDAISDPGTTFFATLGQQWAIGSKSAVSGYTTTNNDSLITMGEPSINPAILNLQASAGRGGVLIVQNHSPVPVALTPNGVETINTVAGPFTIAAASSPTFPTVMLVPTAAGGWFVIGSWGV